MCSSLEGKENMILPENCKCYNLTGVHLCAERQWQGQWMEGWRWQAGKMMGSVWGMVSVQGPQCLWEGSSRGSRQSQVHNPALWGDVQVICIPSAPGKR